VKNLSIFVYESFMNDELSEKKRKNSKRKRELQLKADLPDFQSDLDSSEDLSI